MCRGPPCTDRSTLTQKTMDTENQPEGDSCEVGAAGWSMGAEGGLEVTTDRLDELMRSMEVLLSDVEQLRAHCSHQASELMDAAEELRRQQGELKDSYTELAREMEKVMESVDDLFSTKIGFESKTQKQFESSEKE
ncbi:hypothetical protein NQD34_017623 [Periophthalmus magnuspinnatus]|nr:hypothetical protein NQD34_017623 [Periophthalmus magnuspinnatus]